MRRVLPNGIISLIGEMMNMKIPTNYEIYEEKVIVERISQYNLFKLRQD